MLEGRLNLPTYPLRTWTTALPLILRVTRFVFQREFIQFQSQLFDLRLNLDPGNEVCTGFAISKKYKPWCNHAHLQSYTMQVSTDSLVYFCFHYDGSLRVPKTVILMFCSSKYFLHSSTLPMPNVSSQDSQWLQKCFHFNFLISSYPMAL